MLTQHAHAKVYFLPLCIRQETDKESQLDYIMPKQCAVYVVNLCLEQVEYSKLLFFSSRL